jgi:hypothetical protein
MRLGIARGTPGSFSSIFVQVVVSLGLLDIGRDRLQILDPQISERTA